MMNYTHNNFMPSAMPVIDSVNIPEMTSPVKIQFSADLHDHSALEYSTDNHQDMNHSNLMLNTNQKIFRKRKTQANPDNNLAALHPIKLLFSVDEYGDKNCRIVDTN